MNRKRSLLVWANIIIFMYSFYIFTYSWSARQFIRTGNLFLTPPTNALCRSHSCQFKNMLFSWSKKGQTEFYISGFVLFRVKPFHIYLFSAFSSFKKKKNDSYTRNTPNFSIRILTNLFNVTLSVLYVMCNVRCPHWSLDCRPTAAILCVCFCMS